MVFQTLCALALGSQLLGCGRYRPGKDELVVFIEQPPKTSDPRFAVDSYDFKFARLIYGSLVTVDDQTLEPKLDLADKFDVQGCCTALIHLRDAHFSDGSPFTADDVAKTIAGMRDPKVGSRLRQRFINMSLESVEVLDPHSLRIKLATPRATIRTDFDFGILKNGDQPIGAGPLMLKERDGETYRFTRNPYYYGEPSVTPNVTIKTIRDDNSRLLALVGGSGDLTQNTGSQLLLDAVEQNPRLQLVTGRSSVLTYLGFNNEDPILKDPRVRRAIALAIDRDQIIRQKLRGHAVRATGFLPTFHWAYTRDGVNDAPFDPQRAKQLLDEAGFKDPDGDGPEMRFTLVYRTSSNRWRVALATVIAAMLNDVGIGVDLRVNEFATFFADVKKGNFQLFSMQIPEIIEPDLYDNFFSSNRIPTRDNIDAGGNRMRYRNPTLDALLVRGRETLDREERKRIYADVQRLVANDLPMLALWHEDNFAIVRREVSGYHVIPTAQFTPLLRASKSAMAPAANTTPTPSDL